MLSQDILAAAAALVAQGVGAGAMATETEHTVMMLRGNL